MEGKETSAKRIRKSPEDIEAAVKTVIEKNMSVRSVAEAYGIGKSYLARLVLKAKSLPQVSDFTHAPDIGNRRVFSKAEEELLCQYLKTASKMAYGLTAVQTRQLAFDYAKSLNKEIPPTWQSREKGGVDWLRGLFKRHKDISLRQPEKTSLARATSFNPTNVSKFYENIESILKKYQFTADRIYNGDETGLCTVADQPKVITQRGIKQVAQASSAERGQLVTMLAFISASGNTVPPVFIFPRVRFSELMVEGGPTGSIALCNKSGWMTGDNFSIAFEHFIKHSKPSKEAPVLLMIDNHESHINLNVVANARKNGVIIVTFPPHCSHKLQPLDVSVYGPFKNYFKIAQNNWLTSNPGKTVNIYHLPKFAKLAYESAFTIKNIQMAFAKTGIFPLNSNNFSEDDFLTCYVSDRPADRKNEEATTSFGDTSISSCISLPSTSTPIVDSPISPESVRPFPKAMPLQNPVQRRKKGYSRILTDTPEKEKLEQEQLEKQTKERKKLELKARKEKSKRKIASESSDSDMSVKYAESDIESYHEEFEEHEIEESSDVFEIGNYVLVKFFTKKTKKFAIGIIINMLSDTEFTVKFLKKKSDSFHFIYPEPADIADIDITDIEMKVPTPNISNGTDRMKGIHYFQIDFQGMAFC